MLNVENIKAGYGNLEILKGVNFKAHAGTIHGILGVNGSGKTTLFRTLLGWLPRKDGHLSFNNDPLSPKQLSFLQTKPYCYPYIKGKEYLELLRIDNKDYKIDAWNEIFDLPLDRLAEDYSTGMTKKLALLGLLAQDRPIIILDEPFSGVDVASNEKFQEIFFRLKKSGKIILLSSHLLQTLTHICDEISLLSDGMIQKTYEKDEFPSLENLIKSQIKSKLDTQLNDLFEEK